MAMEAQSPVCTWENVFNNLSSGAKDMGLAPNDIWTHPDDNPQQPQPDPAVMKLQGEMAIKQQQLQQAQQEGQAKLSLMAQQHATDAQMEQYRAQMEADLAIRQQNLQAWVDAHQMALDAHKHAAEMKHKDAESKAKISKLRSGGSLAK